MMGCLGCSGFFSWARRFKSSTASTLNQSQPPVAAPRPHQHTPEYCNHGPQTSSFHDEAQKILQTPVSGMGRNPGLGQTLTFIRSYQPAQSKGPYAPGAIEKKSRVETFDTDTTDETLIGSPVDAEKKVGYEQDTHKSTWQGKPNGTAYDRREEITGDDVDMWARLAM